MLAYHAVFALHRVPSPERPKGLYWGIGLAMFIRFVFLVVGGALVSGSSVARLSIGGILVTTGLLTLTSLVDGAHLRRSKAFQIASTVCSVSETFVPSKWWESFTKRDENMPVLQPNQSKWAIGVPIFVTVLAVELCDSFLTMLNTFVVVSQTSSLFITYSSTAFALMTVRSLYLVMVSHNTSVEPRIKHSRVAGGVITAVVGANLLASYNNFGSHASTFLSKLIGVVAVALAGGNLINWLRGR
jgi:predicted tellurium resistance membrane protein TerC